MLPIKRLSSRLRHRGALAVFAIVVATGSSFGAGGSEAAIGPEGTREAEAARLDVAGCREDAHSAERFAVAKADGGTRIMRLCGAGNGNDRSAIARELSAAIDAEPEDAEIHADARMPELLGLRLMRSRTHVDPSLTREERLARLATLQNQIETLEHEISKAIQPQ